MQALIALVILVVVLIGIILYKGHQPTKIGMALRNGNKRIVVKNHRMRRREENDDE